MRELSPVWGIDVSVLIWSALGQEWVYRGEERTRQLLELLSGAKSNVELALALSEVNHFADSPKFVSLIEETVQAQIPVSIAFAPESAPKTGLAETEQISHSILDLARRYPDFFTLLECHKPFTVHFGVVDGTRAMLEEPRHPAKELPSTVFVKSSNKLGRKLNSLFSQIRISEYVTAVS